ncbi:S-layer homology domain-containing protein [Ructibacterium gallinarum]|uniref:S-layer homology domain-containing protein n=1 Tax=Ructibacterium gallinarum TaxID=2779355 RepID=A0A9D5M4H4_9FIRM|nr:S-layer homology domain-containing protein [Ructibacterium gallinarum]MBE5039394.1 S-layer homology domain-containing protein [Ructibacterium gallinarum]
MKKAVLLVLSVLMLMTTVHAAEIEIRSNKGSGKIQSTKLDDETVQIDVTAQLLDEDGPCKNEYITIAMYGPNQPDGASHEKEIGGKTYYSYYMDQVRADKNGEVSYSFIVKISSEETCYLIFSGKGVENPFELETLLPPADAQVIQPMDPPSYSGGGGGSSGKTASQYTAKQPEDNKENQETVNDANVFVDISDDHWAYEDCMKLYNRGIITGDGNGYLRPEDNISREEVAVVLTKAFKINIPDVEMKMDNTSSLWAKNYLAAAVKNGIMMEDENGTYRGTSYASRAEVVTMVNRCLKREGNVDSLKVFTDYTDIPDYSMNGFSALVEMGVVNGYEDGTVRPNHYITRAELFKIISRILEEVPL